VVGVTLAHIMSGPVDALVELGLPLAIFIGLYWWSSRKGRSKKK
jgi:hypothetical protein